MVWDENVRRNRNTGLGLRDPLHLRMKNSHMEEDLLEKHNRDIKDCEVPRTRLQA